MSLNPHILNASKPKYLSYSECFTSHFTIKYMGKCSPIMQQYLEHFLYQFMAVALNKRMPARKPHVRDLKGWVGILCKEYFCHELM